MTHFRLHIDLGQPMNAIVFGALPAGLLGLYLLNTIGKPPQSLAIVPTNLALGIMSSTFYFIGSVFDFVGTTILYSSQFAFFFIF